MIDVEIERGDGSFWYYLTVLTNTVHLYSSKKKVSRVKTTTYNFSLVNLLTKMIAITVAIWTIILVRKYLTKMTVHIEIYFIHVLLSFNFPFIKVLLKRK